MHRLASVTKKYLPSKFQEVCHISYSGPNTPGWVEDKLQGLVTTLFEQRSDLRIQSRAGNYGQGEKVKELQGASGTTFGAV